MSSLVLIYFLALRPINPFRLSQMLIKEQIPRGLRPGNKKPAQYHYWLMQEAPKKASRLPQLTKRNARMLSLNRHLRRLEASIGPEEAR
jgi:hypothetical protein